jgi:hypothetical protein
MTRASLIATLSLLMLASLVSERAGRGLQMLERVALDNAREWFETNANRVEQALRRKLGDYRDPRRPGFVEEASEHKVAWALGPAICGRARRKTTPATGKAAITALDACGNGARVRVDLHDWIDRIHLSRIDGRWVVVEVSWGFTPPGEEEAPRSRSAPNRKWRAEREPALPWR